MADIIPLGAIPAAEETRSLLLDLQRRFDAGEDIGPRVAHIRQVAAALRAHAGGLRRVLETPDETMADKPEVRALAEQVLDFAERNVAKAEELLQLLADQGF